MLGSMVIISFRMRSAVCLAHGSQHRGWRFRAPGFESLGKLHIHKIKLPPTEAVTVLATYEQQVTSRSKIKPLQQTWK